MNAHKPYRRPIETLHASATSDGDGVSLLRVFGGRHPERFDPFLMFDEFGSNEPSDYIGGFPAHPHRGFETITYMLQGKMEHKDHMGNIGLLEDGDVQWMSAARGIIHSEMPRQTEGKMRGFQIWLNLPAKDKMNDAAYTDLPAKDVPTYNLDKLSIKAVAGHAVINGHEIAGAFNKEATQPIFLDIGIEPGQQALIDIPSGHNAMLYVYEGEVHLGDADNKSHKAVYRTVTRLDQNGSILLTNPGGQVARVILLAGNPLNEPISQYGPFVMNTSEEIEQALKDYQNGTLTI